MTEALLKVLAQRRQQRKDAWENGNTVAYANPEHGLRNAAAIGECHGLRFVQELTLDILRQELEDGEPERAAA